jgi:photosystem II stability/assembly factor-like uncharacterized protein
MKPLIFCLALFILPATAKSQVSWQFTNGPHYANIDDYATGESGGQVALYAADSAYVEAVGNAFVLMSTDRGETWSHVDIKVDGVSVTGTVKCVATFRSNTDIIYAGVPGQGVYRTTDGGTSWNSTNNSQVLNKQVNRIAIHPTNSSIVWIGCLKEIEDDPILYRSENAGGSWDEMSQFGFPSQVSVSDIALSPNSDRVWVSTHSGASDNGIWRTLDRGQDWTPENGGITDNFHLSSLAIDPGNPNVLYCGNKYSNGLTRVYKTTDAADDCQWAPQPTPSLGTRDVSDLRANSQGLVYASVTGYGVLRSTNGGVDWTTLADDLLFDTFKAIEIDPLDESIVYAGTLVSHYKSSDAGATWHERNQGALPFVTGDVGANNGRLLAIGKPEYVFRKESGSTNWLMVFDASSAENGGNSLENMAIVMDPSNSNNALFGWEDEDEDDIHIWRTTDGGLTWTEPIPQAIEGDKLLTDLAYKTSQVVFATVNKSEPNPDEAWTYKSTNGGVSWGIESYFDDTELRSVAISGSSLYIGGKKGGATVYKSTNSGAPWTMQVLSTNQGSLVRSLSAEQSNPNVVYAGTTEGVYKTVDGGSNWAPNNQGIGELDIKAIAVHPTNPSVAYAVSNSAEEPVCYKTTNNGTSWAELSTGLPSAMVHNLTFDPTNPNVLYAATEAGVYSLSHVWTGTITDATWITGETYLVDGTLTIPQGVSLTIEPGTEVKFYPNAKLHVRGSLVANGSPSNLITFTSEDPLAEWSGIEIRNSTSPQAELSYALIEHCATALQVGSNAIFDLSSCTISDATLGLEFISEIAEAIAQTVSSNTLTAVTNGVVLIGTSDVLFKDNIISAYSFEELATGMHFSSSSPKVLRTTIQGFGRGIQCLNGSSPVFEDGALGGNNRIRNNGTGVRCKDYSNANLGIKGTGDVGGQNSIYGNTSYDVQLLNNCQVKGEYNWWGEAPPLTTHFNIDGSSALDYMPFLGEDPNPTNGILGKPPPGGPGSFPTTIPRDLLDALTLRAQGRFSDAMVLLDRVVLSSVIDDWIKEWALSEMLAASQGIRNSTLSSYLLETKNSFPSISRVADFLLPHAYQDEGLWEEALEMFEWNMNTYPESELERDALYGLFLNSLYTTPDTAGARMWFAELELKYPESDETYIAGIQLQNITATGLARIESSSSEQKSGDSQVPSAFRLSQNYPNPFNPTTTIKYNMPVDAHVSLKVYDILGRPVISLVEGSQEAGYHQVSLDASRLASGVYFYRLTAGGFSDVRRLIVVK